MKTIFIAALLALTLTACDGAKAVKCRESVQQMYPGAEVAVIPGYSFRFIVRKQNGAVLYVETMDPNDTSITTAFTAFEGIRSEK
jgi:hypothetical protein